MARAGHGSERRRWCRRCAAAREASPLPIGADRARVAARRDRRDGDPRRAVAAGLQRDRGATTASGRGGGAVGRHRLRGAVRRADPHGLFRDGVDLRDPAGLPLVPARPPTVELTEPQQEVGPLPLEVHEVGPGEYHTFGEVPVPGTWEVDIAVRVTDFDLATATVSADRRVSLRADLSVTIVRIRPICTDRTDSNTDANRRPGAPPELPETLEPTARPAPPAPSVVRSLPPSLSTDIMGATAPI